MSAGRAARREDRRALIAVDLGAESCRVSLLRWKDENPQILLVHRFQNAPEQRANELRWNLERIAAGVEEGLGQCAEIAEEGVRSIAVDGWAVDYVRLSEDGAALEDPFCYRDPRCAAAQSALHEKIGPERLRELTGIQIQPLNTAYQLYADRLNGAKPARWLNLPEYMLHRWGGDAVAERTNATHTGLVGLDGRWSGEIFAAAELELAHAPRIVEPGTTIGSYCGGVRKLHGASLIAPCCHDTASAVAGIPAAQENWAYISSGTWSLIGTVLEAPCNNAEAARENFTNLGAAGLGAAGLGAAGGRVLFHKGITGMWLLRQCMTAWRTEDVAGIVKEASGARSFRAGEWIDVEDPELSLPGEMPARIRAQQARRGLPVVNGIPEMARLIFDSLAGKYAMVLRRVEQITGKKLGQVYVVGGGAQNELLNRLTAEATRLKVKRGAAESSTVGNFAVQLAAEDGDTSAENVARWAGWCAQITNSNGG
jgi:rhamnulokinase